MTHDAYDRFGRVSSEEIEARERLRTKMRYIYVTRSKEPEEAALLCELWELVASIKTPLFAIYLQLSPAEKLELRGNVETELGLAEDAADNLGCWAARDEISIIDRLDRGERVGPLGEAFVMRAVAGDPF